MCGLYGSHARVACAHACLSPGSCRGCGIATLVAPGLAALAAALAWPAAVLCGVVAQQCWSAHRHPSLCYRMSVPCGLDASAATGTASARRQQAENAFQTELATFQLSMRTKCTRVKERCVKERQAYAAVHADIGASSCRGLP